MYTTLRFQKTPVDAGKQLSPLGEHTSCRVFITDKITNNKFLIDTGVDVSVIPRYLSPKFEKQKRQLYAAIGSLIETIGESLLALDLRLRRQFY